VSYTACAARYARRFGLPYGLEGGRCSALPVAWIAAATGAGLCFTEGGVSEELVVRWRRLDLVSGWRLAKHRMPAFYGGERW
jgi:hypothetical protein